VAGASGGDLTLDLPIHVSGPQTNRGGKLLDQNQVSLGEDLPFALNTVETTMQISTDGTYQVVARIDVAGGKSDTYRKDFTVQPAANSPNPENPSGQMADSDQVTVPNFEVFDGVSEMKAVLQRAGLTGSFVAAS